jgi:CRISPR locus-related DNA-binding protein
MLGTLNTVERIAFRRRIDSLYLIFADDEIDIATSIIEKFSSLGIQVTPIHIYELTFSNTLSEILKALNQKTLNDFDIEFAVSNGKSTLILACCIAAAIVNVSVINTDSSCLDEIPELWPSKLVNLTHKKRQILSFLDNHNDSINQKKISQEIGIGQSCISRHLRDLESAGYVTRIRVARKKTVKISNLGSMILHHKQIRKRRIWDSYTYNKQVSIQTVG